MPAPKDRPARRARAMPVLAQGPRAGPPGTGEAPRGWLPWAGSVPVGPPAGTRHENLPVAPAACSLQVRWVVHVGLAAV